MVTSPLNSEPRTPSALPPTSRDFEIFEQNQIQFLSTRFIADKHGLSQTRVRQIVTRVANWLADHLPAKTEAQQQAELRFAQHLAAAQLRHQIEVLRNYFDATGDPKYLRHQTRVITSLARLGVTPGALDSLAADCTAAGVPDDSSARGADIPVCHTPIPSVSDIRGAGLRPASDVGSISAAQSTTDSAITTTSLPSGPSFRACSPPPPNTPPGDLASATTPAATLDDEEFSGDVTLDPETTLQGLAIMERRLLTLLDQTLRSNGDRRSSLETTLATVRRHIASFELRLSPDHPGVSQPLATSTSP